MTRPVLALCGVESARLSSRITIARSGRDLLTRFTTNVGDRSCGFPATNSRHPSLRRRPRSATSTSFLAASICSTLRRAPTQGDPGSCGRTCQRGRGRRIASPMHTTERCPTAQLLQPRCCPPPGPPNNHTMPPPHPPPDIRRASEHTSADDGQRSRAAASAFSSSAPYPAASLHARDRRSRPFPPLPAAARRTPRAAASEAAPQRLAIHANTTSSTRTPSHRASLHASAV